MLCTQISFIAELLYYYTWKIPVLIALLIKWNVSDTCKVKWNFRLQVALNSIFKYQSDFKMKIQSLVRVALAVIVTVFFVQLFDYRFLQIVINMVMTGFSELPNSDDTIH